MKRVPGFSRKKGRMEEFELYNIIEKVTPRLFAELKTITNLFLQTSTFTADLFTVFLTSARTVHSSFAMSRIVGWCAHRIEEIISSNKIIRPAYKSVSKRKDYIPIDLR